MKLIPLAALLLSSQNANCLDPTDNIAASHAVLESHFSAFAQKLKSARDSSCMTDASLKFAYEKAEDYEGKVRKATNANLDGLAAKISKPLPGNGEACKAFPEVKAGLEKVETEISKAEADLISLLKPQSMIPQAFGKVPVNLVPSVECGMKLGSLENEILDLADQIFVSIDNLRGAYQKKREQITAHRLRLETLARSCEGAKELGKLEKQKNAEHKGPDPIPVPHGATPAPASNLTGVEESLRKDKESEALIRRQNDEAEKRRK